MIGQLSKSPAFQVLMGGWAILLLQIHLGAVETSPSSRSATSPPIHLPPEMRLAALPARAPEPADNVSTPEKIALGRLLFFDPILSSTREVSCATCHNPRLGWTDGRATPIGTGGSGIGPARTWLPRSSLPPLERNVPTLLNVGFNGLVSGLKSDPTKAPMFWDSRVQSLEQQAFVPLKSHGEMCGENCVEEEAIEKAVVRVRGIAGYRERFHAAFGQRASDSVTAEHLAQVIAAFERSLITPRTPFDRYELGDALALNTEELRGLRVFQEAGCIQCHGGPMFSDFKLHFIGVLDSTPGGRREFRTPTLRNLRHSAPYMHNGSVRTLRQVLVFYDELAEAVSETLDGGDTAVFPRLDPLLKHLNLNPDDFPALEAFLKTLSTDDYDQSRPTQVPSGLPIVL